MSGGSGEEIAVIHVDDNPQFTDLTSEFLERENDRFSVATTTSPADVLEHINDNIDCIVADFEMPETNGIELLKAVRKDCPNLPFILFTGKGSEEVASDAISAGVTDYLEKEQGTAQFTVLANRITNAVEQYRSQQALADSQQRLSRFIEQSPLGVIEWNDDFEIVRINPAAEEILGYSEAELVGHSWEKIVSDDAYGEVADTCTELLDAEGGYHSVNENVTKGGEQIICEWHNRVVTDNDGEVVAIFSQFQDITERKRRKQELRRKTNLLDQLFEQVPIHLYIKDDQARTRYVSEYYIESDLRSVSDNTDDLIGKTDLEVYGEGGDVGAGSYADDLQVIETGEPIINREEYHAELDVWNLTSKVPRYDEDGETAGVVGVTRRITKRKRYEQAIADLHEVATALTECSTQTAIYERTVEAASSILAFDQAGLAIEENGRLHIRAMSEDIPLEDRPTMAVDEGIAGKTYQTGDPYLISDVTTAEDAAPLGDEMRAVISVPVGDHGIFQMVDEQPDAFDQYDLKLAKLLVQHAEAALRRIEREQELETIYDRIEYALEATDTVFWAADFDSGEATMLIGPLERLFQVDQEIVADVTAFFEHCVHPDDRADVQAVYQQITARESDEFHVVFRTHPSQGTVRWIESLGYIQETDEGLLLVGLSTDVTEREGHKRELERQNERLEELSRVVSHDLRNPLSVAEGHLELLHDEYESDHLEGLAWALDRMDTLIEDLLMIAREGEQVRETESVELKTVCTQCWRNVQTGEATLIVDCDRTISADPSRLKQLLENLFRNAVEHAGKAVTITVGELAASTGFYLEDDGPGIPPEKREAVFEVGYSSSDDGTGFGLRIVEQIAEAHGWEIRVTDGTAGGARFEIRNVEFRDE